jgi:hypothetical protein
MQVNKQADPMTFMDFMARKVSVQNSPVPFFGISQVWWLRRSSSRAEKVGDMDGRYEVSEVVFDAEEESDEKYLA